MSKQAVGIYSTEWVDGDVFADKAAMEKIIAAQHSPGQSDSPSGDAVMESYIVQHKRGAPIGAVIIGQLDGGARFYAKLQDADEGVLTALAGGKLDAARLRVETGLPANKARLI